MFKQEEQQLMEVFQGMSGLLVGALSRCVQRSAGLGWLLLMLYLTCFVALLHFERVWCVQYGIG